MYLRDDLWVFSFNIVKILISILIIMIKIITKTFKRMELTEY